MTSAYFEVEWAGRVAIDRAVVIAKALGPRDIQVTAGMTLGGCLVMSGPQTPPARDPQHESFAFELADAADLPRFGIGSRVALSGPAASDPGAAP